jgi:hypothetical protein
VNIGKRGPFSSGKSTRDADVRQRKRGNGAQRLKQKK